MAFYIKPPSGVDNLHNLSVFGKKRLTFLKQVLQCDSICDFRELLERADTADDSECLIEGTTKDRVSHFLLRLACCKDPELASFFVRAETELFCYRFSSMNATELIRLLKSTYRFLSHLPPSCTLSCHDLLKTLQEMRAGGLTWESIISKYLDGSRSDFIKVPFQYVLSLVARSLVVLKRGVAEVPIADILKVMAFFFEKIVSDGMADARLSVRNVMSEDERMVELLHEIRGLYYAGKRITTPDLTVECEHVSDQDIDKISVCFPPCMQHLHRMLRKKHRLRHFSRIQYTLFLKEIGLPISPALRFWQREYSQMPCCHGDTPGCTHDWQHDGRRYTYSIRHLYGLEGSRVNYRAHSCRSLQDHSLGHGEEGGCPFQHFDNLHLSKTISQAGITSPTDKKQIIDLARKGNLQHACHAFFKKSVAFNLEHLLQSSASFQRADSLDDGDDQPSKKSMLHENSCHLHENATHAKKGHDLSPVEDSLYEKRNLVKPINTTQTNQKSNLISETLPKCIVSSCATAGQTPVCRGSSCLKSPLGSHLDDSISSTHPTNQHTGSASIQVPVLLNQEEQILNKNPLRHQVHSPCTIHGSPVRSSIQASTSNDCQKMEFIGSSSKHSVVLVRSCEETTSKSLFSHSEQLPTCHTGSTFPHPDCIERENLEEPNDVKGHQSRQSNTRSPISVPSGSHSRASESHSQGQSESHSRGPSESHFQGLPENHFRGPPSERHTRGPSESHSQGQSESHFRGPSERHSRGPSESHPRRSSEVHSRSPEIFSSVEPQNQTVTVLKSIHIEKPTDYYMSYIRLLESLHQLENSPS